jgi:Ser/Thr protein kinase RdoA (MazF antagonist)
MPPTTAGHGLPIPRPAIESLLRFGYGLQLVAPPEHLSGPPDVERYACATNAGPFVLRRFAPTHSLDALRRSLEIVEALVHSGFPTAAPLTTRDGQMLALLHERPAALFYAVEGKPLGNSAREIGAAGQLIGRLHFLCGFEDATTLAELPLRSAIEVRLAELARQGPSLAASQASAAIVERLAYLELPEDLPSSILHGALTSEHLVWADDGTLYSRDGEVFARGPQLLDLTLIASQQCFGPPEVPSLRLDLLAELVEGYSLGARRKVWLEEWYALPILIYYGALLLASNQLVERAGLLADLEALPAWGLIQALEADWERFSTELVELGIGQVAPRRGGAL